MTARVIMCTIDTPNISHLTHEDFETVYEPAEDSFILLDALEIELSEIRKLRPTLAVEVGPGSGILSAALANLTSNEESFEKLCMVFACDINLSACKATKRTASRNNASANVEVICSDLLVGIADRLRGKIDLIVCNPPYVVTSDEELLQVKSSGIGTASIEASWAGGKQGCASVTDSLLNILPKILSPKGVCFIVLEQSNKPDILGEYAESLGLSHSVIFKRRAGRELLLVVKLTLVH